MEEDTTPLQTTTNEVAVLLVDKDKGPRDRAYDPLQYPLMFMKG